MTEQEYRYRIYDQTEQHILANNLTLEQAQMLTKHIQKDVPNNTLEIERYTKWLANK